MNGKRISVLSLCMVLGLVWWGGSEAAGPVELKLGYVVASISPDALLPEKFATLVSEKTNGAVKVKTYPGGQLGNLPSMFEGMKLGTIDMMMESPEWLVHVDRQFTGPSLLFLLVNEQHLLNVYNSSWFQSSVDNLRKQHGVRILGYGSRGPYKVLVTKKPVKSVDDMKGMKFRIPELPIYRAAFEALEVRPTVIAWTEVYLALQQGLVEGLDSPLTLVYDMKFQDAAKYIINTKHAYQNICLMISEKRFQSLSEDVRKKVLEAADEAGKFQTAALYKTAEEHIQKLKSGGATFIDVDSAPFAQKVIPRYKKLEEEGTFPKGISDLILGLKPKK